MSYLSIASIREKQSGNREDISCIIDLETVSLDFRAPIFKSSCAIRREFVVVWMRILLVDLFFPRVAQLCKHIMKYDAAVDPFYMPLHMRSLIEMKLYFM
jgi:hypothetical protein